MNLKKKIFYKYFLFITILTILIGFNVGDTNLVYAQGADWTMAGANPERSSWTSETLPGNIKTTWVKPINPHISQHTQVIAAEGKVFVSTAKGLYAFDANSGSELWVYPTELPLGHSPTYSNGLLYVGGMDRKMHAVNSSNGQGVWTFTADGGFSTNPVVVNGRVFAGNRDGNFYAIDSSNGNLIWKYTTENQILQSAAYKDNVLYFASNDGYAYALNSGDGSLVWKSANKLPGMGQYSWWPVVYQNYVIFTRTTFEVGQESTWLFCPPGSTSCTISNNRIPGTFVTDTSKEITNQPTMDVSANPNGSTFPNFFETYPHRRNAIFLERANGVETQFDIDADGNVDAAPISWVGDAGTRYPPIVSGYDNVLYFRTINRSFGSFSSATISGWNVGTPFVSLPFSNTSQQSGAMPGDEPVGISGAGNKVYWNLCCDRYVGAVDLSQRNVDFFSSVDDGNRQWRYITSPGLPFYTTPTNIGMPVNYYQEATKFFWDPPYPAIFWNENDKVGPTIYQGKLYVILGNALVAFGEGGAGSAAPTLQSAPPVDVQSSSPSLTTENLKARLEQQVSKILAAGHLKPSYVYVGLLNTDMRSRIDDYGLHYWHNPADIHLVLLRALPYLSENLQISVKNFLQEEMTNYSPVKYSHIGWTGGAQRDPYPYPPSDPRLFNINFGPIEYVSFSGWGQPPHNIYAVWKYAQAGLGDPVLLFSQVQNKLKPQITQIKTNLTDSYLAGFPHIHNAYIAGYHGYVELAKLAGQTEAQYLPYQTELNRLLSLRAQNLTAFPIPPSAYASDHGYFDTLITAWNFMYLTPELADYLATNAEQSVGSIIDTYKVAAPNWMIAHNGETQGESAIVPYQQTHSLFQAIAMIKNASQSELSKYLDTPIVPAGDLYYIDNLVATLEAGSGATGPFRGDANSDGLVNEGDYDIWKVNYEKVDPNGVADGDFNLDSRVDGVDYAIWFKTYGT